jgi:DNA-binding CsgD family transcriptional regulator
MNEKTTSNISVAIWLTQPDLGRQIERLLRSDAAIEGIRAVESAAELLDLMERGTVDIVVADAASVAELVISADPPIGGTSRSDRNGAGQPRLTPRELQVLSAMADGASNKAIARRLGISVHTVKFHVAAILAKLDADSRTEAVMKAAQSGMVMV